MPLIEWFWNDVGEMLVICGCLKEVSAVNGCDESFILIWIFSAESGLKVVMERFEESNSQQMVESMLVSDRPSGAGNEGVSCRVDGSLSTVSSK